jgi:UDP-glucose 4-epimerase
MNKVAIIISEAAFLGSYLCEKMIENDISVICIDNLSTGSLKNIEHLIGNDKFKFI